MIIRVHSFLQWIILGTMVFGAPIVNLPFAITDNTIDDINADTDDVESPQHIVGGNTADISEYPWLINIRYNDEFICGGSILDEMTILTAAHCVEDDRKGKFGEYTVRAGDYQTVEEDDHEQIRDVSRIIVHKRYNTVTIDRDIAVLKLDRPLLMNDYVQTIPLANFKNEKRLMKLQNCWLSGKGDKNNHGETPSATKELKVTMLSRKGCYRKSRGYDTKYTKFMTCSKNSRAGACSGDSGGPLTCFDRNGNPFLVGVVSWGSANCWAGYNVYARVSTLRSWAMNYIE